MIGINMSVKFAHIAEIESLSDTVCLQSGIPELDVYLRRGTSDLIFLGGRPGSGKTLLALQVAYQVSLKEPALFFSLEMTKEQLKGRLSKSKGFTGRNSQFMICDTPGLFSEEIVESVLDVGFKPALVVIDYAQIVQEQGRSKAEEVGLVVRKLKALAKEISAPILLLAQLSRDIEKRSAANEFAEPQMSDFADSAEIEKWADCCLMLHHVPKSDGVTRVYCTKNRHGDSSNFDLKLNRGSLRFESIDQAKIYQF